jgi:beta-1,4-mannooligosaccharide/beta-1,4-mannosyl-N-acetylglucosamine phosphorylase
MKGPIMAITIVGDPLPNIPWQDKPKGHVGVLWRDSRNPIIGWNPSPSIARVFNSACVPWEGGFIGVFRADHRDVYPHLHVGRSTDGLTWEFEDAEIDFRDEDGKQYISQYSYDPRVVKIDDTYYVTWCTDFGGPALGLARTTDFTTFTRMENICTPYNRNGVLFPRKLDGDYVLLTRPSDAGHTAFGNIFLSRSTDLIHWGRHRLVMTSGPVWWEGTKVGAGAPPIETSEGWLLFYHGVQTTCNGYVYSFGAVLLDLEQPEKVLHRTRNYLITPEKDYETTGMVPNVAFPCAALHDPKTGRLALYYGAADTYVAVAYGLIPEIVEHIKADSELIPGDAESWRG